MSTEPSAIEIKDLRLLQAIADRGGVTAAARALHLTQSAVSHHLARVQERLGVELFRRAGRKLEITDAGRKLVALSRELDHKLAQAERELRGREAPRPLRISTQCYTAYHWLPGLLDHVGKTHPRISVSIQLNATLDPLQHLREGTLDLAICHGALQLKPHWIGRLLFVDRFVVITAPSHPFAGRKRLRTKDLESETLFTYDLTPTLREEGRALFRGTRGPKRIETVPLTEATVQLVRSGRGVSILSTWAAQPYADAGDVVAIPLAGPHTTRKWTAVYDGRSPLREGIDAVIDGMRAQALGTLDS
jgi:LysR family transcriptional regulator for metE and metH